MKASLALALAFSILAPTAAFASADPTPQRPVAAVSSTVAPDSKVASNPRVTPFDSQSTGRVVVAENRKEFGSGYQRY